MTVTFLAPSAALDEIMKFGVIVVELTTVTPLTVTPLPETVTDVPVVVKLVPVSVTGTVVPRTPVFGETTLRVGGGGTTTANLILLVVPPGAVTLTFLTPSPAVAEIVKIAVTVVSFTTARLLMVTPFPDTLIALAPVSPLPVIVTGTLSPSFPVLGEIEVIRTASSTVNV